MDVYLKCIFHILKRGLHIYSMKCAFIVDHVTCMHLISLPENLIAFNPCVLHHSFELLGVVKRGQREGYSIDFLLLCVFFKHPTNTQAPPPVQHPRQTQMQRLEFGPSNIYFPEFISKPVCDVRSINRISWF